MKKRTLSILLILIMVVCFGVAASYPVIYLREKESNETDMASLRAMRMSALDNSAGMDETADAEKSNAGTETPTTGGSVSTEAAVSGSADGREEAVQTVAPEPSAAAEAVQEPAAVQTVQPDTTAVPKVTEAVVPLPGPVDVAMIETPDETGAEAQPAATEAADEPAATEQSEAHDEPETAATEQPDAEENESIPTERPNYTVAVEVTPAATPEPTAEPEPTEEPIDRYDSEGYAQAYTNKEQIQFDESNLLPQYRDIYELNNDLVGWLNIPGTVIDYPVVRNDDPDYYLDRDFFGETNSNGQLILDSGCDPWTPSYNLVISGHNMKSGQMFAQLVKYESRNFWAKHKTFTFDSVLREGTYVVFAAFHSADYAEDEEGFRYNANIQYRRDAQLWLEDIAESSEYDTGIDVEFGDEFLTLTTCEYHREDGRFVVVARRVREGEVIE